MKTLISYHMLWAAALSVTSMFSASSCLAEECGKLKPGAGIGIAAEYLGSANIRQGQSRPECVKLAFGEITSAPPAEAIPVLVRYLGWRRPPDNARFSLQANSPDKLYPAVYSLFTIGAPAEEQLVTFIGESSDEKSVERNNAMYTLLLIHHGNGLGVVEALASRSKLSSDSDEKRRLRDAANDAMRWCEGQLRDKCEKTLATF
jgi:hypothetical protein